MTPARCRKVNGRGYPAFKRFSVFYVYVIRSEAEDFYIGFSKDLKRRMEEHNASKTRSTSAREWKSVYCEAYLSEKAARDKERMLKHDGRTRRHLMKRIIEGLTEPFNGGGSSELKPR